MLFADVVPVPVMPYGVVATAPGSMVAVLDEIMQ